jgi:hypothetical protein
VKLSPAILEFNGEKNEDAYEGCKRSLVDSNAVECELEMGESVKINDTHKDRCMRYNFFL